MNKHDMDLINGLEKILYDGLEEKLKEFHKLEPEIISSLKNNTKDICVLMDEKIDSLNEIEDDSIEKFLNLSISYFIEAVAFELADESFFSEETIIDVE